MNETRALFLTTLIFISLDTLWFMASLKPIYEPSFQSIQGSPLNLRISGGIVAWLLLALGIRHFGILNGNTKPELFTRGALLGFVIYGVYNATNYATFSNYPIKAAIADTLWGTFAVGAVTVISSML